VNCSGALSPSPADTGRERHFSVPRPALPGRYKFTAILEYRKLDQFVVNYFLGENSGVTAPVVEIARATALIEVKPAVGGAPPVISLTKAGL
jgi:hypothetical protein